MTDEHKPAGESLTPATGSLNGNGLLDGYPGPALILRPVAGVVAANPRGAGVEALLKHNSCPSSRVTKMRPAASTAAPPLTT